MLHNSHKHFLLPVLFSIILVPATLMCTVGIILASDDSTVSDAELTFVERSVIGYEAGSVVPASCNSVPPVSHFPNDCPGICDPFPNSQYDPGTNSCVCKNGAGVEPTCNVDVDVMLGTAPGGAVSVTSFSISPSAVYLGGTMMISWSSSGATSCRGNWKDTKLGPSGTEPSPKLYDNGTFSIICTNGLNWSAAASQTFIVSVPPPPPYDPVGGGT